MGKRQGRNRHNTPLDPIKTKASYVLTLAEAGLTLSENRYKSDHGWATRYFAYNRFDSFVTGEYESGEKREWELMTIAALKHFNIDHPYNQ